MIRLCIVLIFFFFWGGGVYLELQIKFFFLSGQWFSLPPPPLSGWKLFLQLPLFWIQKAANKTLLLGSTVKKWRTNSAVQELRSQKEKEGCFLQSLQTADIESDVLVYPILILCDAIRLAYFKHKFCNLLSSYWLIFYSSSI